MLGVSPFSFLAFFHDGFASDVNVDIKKSYVNKRDNQRQMQVFLRHKTVLEGMLQHMDIDSVNNLASTCQFMKGKIDIVKNKAWTRRFNETGKAMFSLSVGGPEAIEKVRKVLRLNESQELPVYISIVVDGSKGDVWKGVPNSLWNSLASVKNIGFSDIQCLMDTVFWRLQNATSITLSYCPQITGSGFVYFKNATTINITNCPKITSKAKEALRQRGVNVID
ncbi:MAG: hypothetical protein ACPGXY_05910 [Alphaproteobacteria bacterium]